MEAKMWWRVWLLCWLWRHSNGAKVKVKGNRVASGEEFKFEALRCDNSHALARYSSRQFCNMGKIRAESGVAEKTAGGEYVVLQHNPEKRFKATICEMRVSTLTAVCGAFSHSKLVEPPDVLKPVRVSHADCSDITASQLLTTQDGRQLRTPVGTEITYKYVKAGAVTLAEGNVACEGGDIRLDGKKHENIIELVTVNFKLQEVEIRDVGGRLRTREGYLPPSCLTASSGCELGDMTLVIDATKVDWCPYSEVRGAYFQKTQLDQRNLLVNDEHKMLFEAKTEIQLPRTCPGQGNIIQTNFKRLFLYRGNPNRQIVSPWSPETMDLEMEERVTDFYLEYWTLMLSRESRADWQQEICELSANRLNEEQVVIHGEHLLRMKGELVHEFKCETVIVTAREGHRAEGERCLDHLPVFTAQQELMYLAPLTRLLVPRNGVSSLNCSSNFPVTIEDVQGRMVTANPAVAVVEVELSEYHLQDKTHPNHTELFDVKSLLYTPEEIADYESLLLGPNSERVVSRQFSSYYCKATGECAASRGAEGFQWGKMLQDPETLLTGWWEDLKDWLLWWGAVWGCIDSVLTGLHVLWRLKTVFCGVPRHNLGKRTLMKVMFLPGEQLLNMVPRAAGRAVRNQEHKKTEAEEEGEQHPMRVFSWEKPPQEGDEWGVVD